MRQESVTTWFGSTTSTSGSLRATSRILLMLKPYTFSHPTQPWTGGNGHQKWRQTGYKVHKWQWWIRDKGHHVKNINLVYLHVQALCMCGMSIVIAWVWPVGGATHSGFFHPCTSCLQWQSHRGKLCLETAVHHFAGRREWWTKFPLSFFLSLLLPRPPPPLSLSLRPILSPFLSFSPSLTSHLSLAKITVSNMDS